MTLQRLGLERAGCESIIDEGRSGDPRRVRKLLLRLRAGDELLIYSLDALQRSPGELIQFCRYLIRAGVVLRLAEDTDKFAPILQSRSVRRLIELLAAHEDEERGKARAQQVRGGSRNPLSRFQIDYARRLHKQGASLRTIGQIFQLSPNEIWDLISAPRV